MIPRRGLYAILDTSALDARGLDVLAFARAVLAGRPSLIQLRAKNRGANETLALLSAVGPLAAAAGVPLFANDRPDLAVLAGVPGVHVGQGDLSLAAVRLAFPSLLVGVSTHEASEVAAALGSGACAPPDYLAFGPVYPTTSKADAEPVVGIAALAGVVARAGGRPVVGIGGIDLARAAEIGAAGALAAVIGALLPPPGSSWDAVTDLVVALQRAACSAAPETAASRSQRAPEGVS